MASTFDSSIGGPRRSAQSFRDPHSFVEVDQSVLRHFDEHVSEVVLAFLESQLFDVLVERGDLDAPQLVEPRHGVGLTLEHTRIETWSYPWEWTWSMLRDAALMHLDMLRTAVVHGWTMSDASSFNIVFRGGRPVFIDHGSFVLRKPSDPWWAYTAFCEHFLYPLMVSGYCGVDLASLLRGGLGRVSLADAYGFLKTHKRRRGVLKHVLLPYLASAKSDPSVSEVETSAASMNDEIYSSILDGLHDLITRLPTPEGQSTWSDYGARSHYERTSLEQKEAFVTRIVAAAEPKVVLDLGANDGHFSSIASEHAGTVVAADSDALVVDRLYRSNRRRNILPLVFDVLNPSPSMGWRLGERTGFFERVTPDLTLALAVFHHVCLSGNVPLSELARWMGEIESDFVVEFVHRDDPKVQHLLSRKTEPESFDYGLEAFLEATAARFTVKSQEQLEGGTRTMLHLAQNLDLRDD